MDEEYSKELLTAGVRAQVRIRDLLKQVVPPDWIEARFEVVVAGPSEDHICSIVGPIRNMDSDEEIHDLPEGLLDAVEEFCLIDLISGLRCTRYVHRLATLSSGSKYIGVYYIYD